MRLNNYRGISSILDCSFNFRPRLETVVNRCCVEEDSLKHPSRSKILVFFEGDSEILSRGFLRIVATIVRMFKLRYLITVDRVKTGRVFE